MDMDQHRRLQATRRVLLHPGPNRQTVRVPALEGGSTIHEFKAIFEADATARPSSQPALPGMPQPEVADTLTANNTAESYTFVKGKGRVLYVDNVAPSGRRAILEKRSSEQITEPHRRGLPPPTPELLNYDAVVPANARARSGHLTINRKCSRRMCMTPAAGW
jgi:hypothetical protein